MKQSPSFGGMKQSPSFGGMKQHRTAHAQRVHAFSLFGRIEIITVKRASWRRISSTYAKLIAGVVVQAYTRNCYPCFNLTTHDKRISVGL